MASATLALSVGSFALTGSTIPTSNTLEIDELLHVGGFSGAPTDRLTAAWRAHGLLKDLAMVGFAKPDVFGWQPVLAHPVSWDDIAAFAAVSLPTWRPGAVVAEVLSLRHMQEASAVYNLTRTELAKIAGILGIGHKFTFRERITVTELLKTVRALAVLEQLALKDTPTALRKLSPTLAELIKINPVLNFFTGGSFVESGMITDMLLPVWQYAGGVAEQISLDSVLGETLLIQVLGNETLNVEDSTLLRSLYLGLLDDELDFSMAYLSPGGGFTTWAMNARSGAVTEYTNYAFNSFARMGNVYLGADATGLYELSGDTDAGRPVVADLVGGAMGLSGSRFTSFQAAYLGLRGDGKFFLKLTPGTGHPRVYEVKTQSMRTARVNIGKGLRSRYFTWQLTSVGQDFDLDSIEFLPISSTRRTG